MENPFKKNTSTTVVENPTGKALKSIENDPALKRAYDSWAGRVDKSGASMQEKFLEAVNNNPGLPIGYNKYDETFVPVQYSGFN